MQYPKILAIFYAEFDATLGPKVLFDTPEGYSAQVDFESVSEYIIPKSELCNRLVSIETDAHIIIGHPVQIRSSSYDRNVLIFNLCFIFGKEDVRVYEQIVVNIARVLRTLEIDTKLLSSERKSIIGNMLVQLMQDLNQYEECQINIDFENRLDLKIFPCLPDPPTVYEYQVPVLRTSLKKHVDKRWDLTLQRVTSFLFSWSPILTEFSL
jgi:uncharacterized protein YbcI